MISGEAEGSATLQWFGISPEKRREFYQSTREHAGIPLYAQDALRLTSVQQKKVLRAVMPPAMRDILNDQLAATVAVPWFAENMQELTGEDSRLTRMVEGIPIVVGGASLDHTERVQGEFILFGPTRRHLFQGFYTSTRDNLLARLRHYSKIEIPPVPPPGIPRPLI